MKRFLVVLSCILISGLAVRKAVAQPAPPPPPPAAAPAAPRARRTEAVVVRGHSGSFLGVNVDDVTEENVKSLKLKEERGALIRHVEENGPAAKAGLKENDVVMDFNGNRIEGVEQFVRLVGETPAGRKVQIVYSRDGNTQTATAVLGKRSESLGMAPRVFRMDSLEGLTMPEMPEMPEVPELPEMPEMAGMHHRGMIGIETEPLHGQLAEFFGVKDGALVRAVTKNSPAEKSGLKAGDVIVKINNEPITSARDILTHTRTMANEKEHKPLGITVMRNKREMTLSVTPE